MRWDCRILGVYSFSCAVCLSGYEFIDSTIDSNGTKWEEKGRERERLLSCGYWVGVMSIREDDRCDSSVDTVDVKDIGWTL